MKKWKRNKRLITYNFYSQESVFLRIGNTSALTYDFYNKNNILNTIIALAQDLKEKAVLFLIKS